MSTVLTCALQAVDEQVAAVQRAAEETGGTGDATTSAAPQVQLILSKRISGNVFLALFAFRRCHQCFTVATIVVE